MHCVKVEYPTDWADCTVYPVADLHIGDPHADMEQIRALMKRIEDDPRALVILNGDLLNTAVK